MESSHLLVSRLQVLVASVGQESASCKHWPGKLFVLTVALQVLFASVGQSYFQLKVLDRESGNCKCCVGKLLVESIV